MLETLLIWVMFMCADVALSIKRVPLFGFLLGIIQFVVVTCYMLSDSEFNIILTMVCGLMAGVVIILNALEMKR